MQHRMNDVWIVRRSAWILIGWFVLVGLLFGRLILWPQFDSYVDKVSVAKQYEVAQLQQHRLVSLRSDRLARLSTESAKAADFTPTHLAAALESRALDVLEIQVRDTQWVVQLSGRPEVLWSGVMTVLSEIQGLTLSRIALQSEDAQARATLELRAAPRVLKYPGRAVIFEVAPARFGLLSGCPDSKLTGRVGQTLWVEDETARRRLQLGDWLNADWRIVGVHQSRLVLKSDLGTSCLGGNPS